MKKLLPVILCLFTLQCEQGWLEDIVDPTEPTVEGCNISSACNYNPDVTKFDDSCEYASCLDCLGYPHGVAIADSCGTCDVSLLNDCTQDCSSTWGGTAYVDGCQICVSGNTGQTACTTETDCAGVLGGTSYADNCGTCDSDSSNDCVQDCAGTWGGSATADNCGICGGDNTDCTDCLGVVGGTATVDQCGVCGGNNDCTTNYSLKFDGVDDYIQLSSSVRVGTTPITVMFRAKTDNYSVSASMDIISQACDTDCDGDFRLQFSTGQCELEGVSFKSPAHFATYPFNVGDNKWHNYVYVFGENGDYSYSKMKVYVDGNEISFNCGHNWGEWNYSLPDIPMTIGKGIDEHNYFSGYIYNIAVFSKSLSMEMVQGYVDYSFSGNENDLVGYWNFNEGSGTNIFDLTGNANHGIINGANWTICDDNNYDCVNDYDCAGVLGGSATIDCAGECNGTAVDADGDGVCDDGETNPYGCTNSSACNFDATATIFDDTCWYTSEGCACSDGEGSVADECGTCDTDTSNDCPKDECGEWGGDNSTCTDNCGIVNGDNSPNTGTCDCAGTPSGTATTDNCGSCDTDSSNNCVQDCAGAWGGTAVLSGCDNVCNSTAVVDCAGVCGSGVIIDACGVCGGDGSSCVCDGLTEVELWGEYYDIETTTSIDKNNQGFGGSIPPEIGCLTNLTFVLLARNQFTGSIPTEIGNLTNLTFLDLENNQLTGSISWSIGNLTNLTGLLLMRNQLTGEIPSEIGNLTNLTILSLFNNQLSGEIPIEIGNMTSLTHLSLFNNQLTGEIPQEVCDLIESNNINMSQITLDNNLTNTCE